MRARYYDSSIGRFLSEDPARDGINWYLYCDGNPVMGVDFTGKFVEALMIIFVAVALLFCIWAIIQHYCDHPGVDDEMLANIPDYIPPMLTEDDLTNPGVDWGPLGDPSSGYGPFYNSKPQPIKPLPVIHR